jgi:hypothetical protein
MLAVVKGFGPKLQNAPEDFKTDHEFMLAAVKVDNSLLKIDWVEKITGKDYKEPKTLEIRGMGVEIVVGHIDKESADKINKEMSYGEVEEIVGEWYAICDIFHEYNVLSDFELIGEGTAKIPKLKMVNAGTEKIPIKGKGYMMVTVSWEEGTFGTITVDSDAKKLKYYKKTYKIAGDDFEVVTGFNCDGEDLDFDIKSDSTENTSVDIAIYNCKNGEQIW